jgi:hypothetical protein
LRLRELRAVHGNDPRHGRLLRAELILHGPYRAARQARAQASAQRGKTQPNIFTDEGQTDTSRSFLNQKDRLAAVSPKSDQVFWIRLRWQQRPPLPTPAEQTQRAVSAKSAFGGASA